MWIVTESGPTPPHSTHRSFKFMFFFLLVKAQELKARLAHCLCPQDSSVSQPKPCAQLLQPLSPITLLVAGCIGLWATSHPYSPWGSGAAQSWWTCCELLTGPLKPAMPSYTLLPRQICPGERLGLWSLMPQKIKAQGVSIPVSSQLEEIHTMKQQKQQKRLQSQDGVTLQIPDLWGQKGFLDIILWKFVFLDGNVSGKREREERKGDSEAPVWEI